MAPATIDKLPTPQEIDDAAKEYCDLEKQIDEIFAAAKKKIEPLNDRLAPLSEQLKAWGENFGGAHATKSKLLTGLAYEVMTTISSITSLDQAVVAAFLDACKKAGQSRIFAKLFDALTVYRTKPGADQVARATLPPRLAVAFMRCFITNTNAPRMEVRPRKVIAGVTA
jgi:hypothetical protein